MAPERKGKAGTERSVVGKGGPDFPFMSKLDHQKTRPLIQSSQEKG